MSWNDTNDRRLVTEAFEQWGKAVLGKDREALERIHDPGFKVTVGNALLDKAGHIELEMQVAAREIRLTELTATRRLGDLILAWSKHRMAADHVPGVASADLQAGWVPDSLAQAGFEQREFSVWRQHGDTLQCVAFELTLLPA